MREIIVVGFIFSNGARKKTEDLADAPGYRVRVSNGSASAGFDGAVSGPGDVGAGESGDGARAPGVYGRDLDGDLEDEA